MDWIIARHKLRHTCVEYILCWIYIYIYIHSIHGLQLKYSSLPLCKIQNTPLLLSVRLSGPISGSLNIIVVNVFESTDPMNPGILWNQEFRELFDSAYHELREFLGLWISRKLSYKNSREFRESDDPGYRKYYGSEAPAYLEKCMAQLKRLQVAIAQVRHRKTNMNGRG